MNKTPKINRLFLITVLWSQISGIFLGFMPFTASMTKTQLLVISQLLYITPVIVFMIRNKVDPRRWMPLKPLKISVFAKVILFTFLLIPVVTWLNLISMLFVKNAFESSTAELAQNSLWINLITMALIPAFCEEFTFRGLYYNGYRQRGVWCAILGSALAFALMHMNFNQFCYAFVLGIAFGLLLEATGSIFATITAHFVINGWSTLVLAISRWLSNIQIESSALESSQAASAQSMLFAIAAYTKVAMFCLVAAVLVLIWIAKSCNRLPHLKWCFQRKQKRAGEAKTMFTPAFGIATVVVVFLMLLVG